MQELGRKLVIKVTVFMKNWNNFSTIFLNTVWKFS